MSPVVAHRPLRRRHLGAAQWPGGRQALACQRRRERAAGLGCRTGLCRWRKGPWRIALVSDDRRLAESLRQCRHRACRPSTPRAPLPRPAAGDRPPRRLARGRAGAAARRAGRAPRDRQCPPRRSAVGAGQPEPPGRAGQGAGGLEAWHSLPNIAGGYLSLATSTSRRRRGGRGFISHSTFAITQRPLKRERCR